MKSSDFNILLSFVFVQLQQISNDQANQQQQPAGIFGMMRPGMFWFLIIMHLSNFVSILNSKNFLSGNMPPAMPMISPQQRMEILKRPEAQVLIQSNRFISFEFQLRMKTNYFLLFFFFVHIHL